MNFRAHVNEDDSTLESSMNVTELLNTVIREEDDTHQLWSLRAERLGESLDRFILSHQEKNSILDKLQGYKPVHEIHELQKGRHIRWIRTTTPEIAKITNGGILMEIKFMDSGTHLLCMNLQKRFIQYKWDDCITFQKMTIEELCIRHHLLETMDP